MTTNSEKERFSQREILRDIQLSLAKIETHNEYTMKALEANNKDIGELKSAHNKQKGAIAVVSAVGLTGTIAFIKHLFS